MTQPILIPDPVRSLSVRGRTGAVAPADGGLGAALGRELAARPAVPAVPATPVDAPNPAPFTTAVKFDVRLIKLSPGKLVVEAMGPFGEAVAEVDFPAFDLAAVTACETVRHLSPYDEAENPHPGPDLLDRVAALRRQVGEALMSQPIRECYKLCLAGAERKRDRGVRVRLFTYGPGVAAVPWESAFFDRRFLAISSSRVAVVRYVLADRPPARMSFVPPLRVLGVIGNSPGSSWLNTDQERRLIRDALGARIRAGDAHVEWLEPVDVGAFRRALGRGFYAVHFAGHGEYDPALRRGRLQLGTGELSADHLVRILQDKGVELAVLNACETGHHAGGLAELLVAHNLSAAVGMRTRVLDSVAVDFAGAFYEALGRGWPVDAAVYHGRMAIIDNTLGTDDRSDHWTQPVLYMRSPDGVLFTPAGSTN